MGSWVEDFNSFQNSGDPILDGFGGGITSKSAHKPPSRKEKIEAELKLLEWHKMANDAALKAAMLQTKNLKTVPVKEPSHAKDDARYIQKVIQDEHVKPLQVSKKYVLDYEKKEQETDERLTNQVERHISTLKKLREKLEERSDVKSRADEFRSWRKDFSSKKLAVMSGRTLGEVENEMGNTANSPTSRGLGGASAMGRDASAKSLHRGGSQELSTVLDSLNKLSELEKRISSLEKDNEYEHIMAKERPVVDQRVTFEFKKQRVPIEGSQGGMGTAIAMRAKKAAWEVQLPGTSKAPPAGTGVMAARARKRVQESMQQYNASRQNRGVTGRGGGGGDGVFLTGMGGGSEDDGGMESDYVDREALRRERAREQAAAPAGQKNLRARVQARKARAKDSSVGVQRHEEALKEINRRRQEQQLKSKRAPAASVVSAAKGASAGIKTKNKHMLEFEKAKSGFKKKKENMMMPAPPPPRMTSNTAPTGGAGRRQPATKTGGTVTRRTDAPTRRPVAGGAAGGPMYRANEAKTAPPAIAVSGVGGIKVLRGQKAGR